MTDVPNPHSITDPIPYAGGSSPGLLPVAEETLTGLSLEELRELPLQSLPLTGERTVPGIAAENYWFRRHEAVYDYLRPQVAGAQMLEVGCGEGYGAALLAGTARLVVGLDYDEFAIGHCARTYPQAHFVRANLAALPIRSTSVDVVVSLQVIEHVWDHGQFIDECVRVLRPGGQLIISTPNRLTFSPDNDGTTAPTNPFHTHEFVADELSGLLQARGMREVTVFGLQAGPGLRALDARYGGSFIDAQLQSPPHDWPAELSRDVAAVATSDFEIRSEDVAASLDLIAVART